MLQRKEIHLDELIFTIHASQLKSSQPFLLSIRSENLDKVIASGIAVTSVEQAYQITLEIINQNKDDIRKELSKIVKSIIEFESDWNNISDSIFI